ncbi:hypothetical protein Ancab_007819 [Ancistrocladus abbreviatus]
MGKTFAGPVEGKEIARNVDTSIISDSPEVDVPESSSLPTELSKHGWLPNLGLGPLPKPQSLGLKHRQSELEHLRRETTQEGPLSPLPKERSISPGPQGLNGPLHSPCNANADNSLLHIVRESPEDIVELRTGMASNRKIRKKSLAEISGSKLSTGKHGCRSKRVHRQMMNTRGPSSQLFFEEEDSGMYLYDSQIENMNLIICKQDSLPVDMELSPTLSQIWSYLTRIGVKGTTTAEDMVNCIKTMEQRDLENFLENVQVPEADCT